MALLVVFSALAGLAYFLYRWLLPKPIPGVPYDEFACNSIWGNMWDVMRYKQQQGEVRPWFAAHSVRHQAPLTQAWLVPFSKPVLILSDYQESQDLCLRRGKEFHRGHRNGQAFQETIPEHHIAMMSSDPRFKVNKQLVRDLMTPGFLHDVSAPQIHAKSMDLVELWSMKAEMAQDRPFDALRDIFDAATDMINAAAFALDDSMSATLAQLHYLQTAAGDEKVLYSSSDRCVEFPQVPESADIAAFRALAEHVGVLFNSLAPRLEDWCRMRTSVHLKTSARRKDEMIRREVEKSLQKQRNGDEAMFSALDHLLQRERAAALKEGREPDYHSKKIYDELLGYVVAGHETSATALCWMVKLIATHQDVQKRLQTALETAYPSALTEGRQPTASEITSTSIPYLDAVIEESLRYLPPIPLLMRSAAVDTTLLGRHVPKGTVVFMPALGPGYAKPAIPADDKLRSNTSLTKGWGCRWNDGDVHLFNPDRWLKTGEQGEKFFDSQAGPFITFGLGPRSCFGRRLAYLEIRLILVLLMWNFRFKKLEGRLASNEAVELITTSPKACYVALERIR